LLIFLLLCCALPMLGAAQQQKARFPSVTGYSLDKQKVSLPGGSKARRSPAHLVQAGTGSRHDPGCRLRSSAARQFQFHYYQLPVAERENFVFRWWEASSIAQRSDRSRNLALDRPALGGSKSFFADLQIPMKSRS